MEQSVPKRRHINFRRRGITQKKAYNVKDIAKNLKWFKEIMKRLFYENTEGQKVTVSSKIICHFPFLGIYDHDVNFDDF
jgi:hypothetical protein